MADQHPVKVGGGGGGLPTNPAMAYFAPIETFDYISGIDGLLYAYQIARFSSLMEVFHKMKKEKEFNWTLVVRKVVVSTDNFLFLFLP